MKKRLLALLIAVICISITAVGSFAYTPNTTPTIVQKYPDQTYFYGTVPSNGQGYQYFESLGTGELLRCPVCDNPVIGIEIPISTYVSNDITYINTEVMDGLYITGMYNDYLTYNFGGRLIVGPNDDGNPREYGQNINNCAYTNKEDLALTLDLMFAYDFDYGLERAFIYTHYLPLGFYGVPSTPNIQVVCIPLIDKTGATNPILNTCWNEYNDMYDNNGNFDDYYKYNSRVINPSPFESVFSNIFGYDEGYDDGYQDGIESTGNTYQEGYNVGYEEGYTNGTTDGFQNGFNEGRIQGQTDKEMLDGMFVDLFDGLFGSLEGFTDNLLSLGWGTLTIGAMLGLLGVILVTMLIIKIIRG